jgi:hypothetical protein
VAGVARFLLAALMVAALLVPNAAAAPHVDVVVDAGTATLSAEHDGTHTTTAKLSNFLVGQVPLQARVIGQPACTVDASPSSLEGGTRTKVTFTLHASCHVASGVRISLGFGAAPTRASPAFVAEPATPAPRWDLVGRSFFFAFLAAVAFVGLIGRKIHHYNHLGARSSDPPADVPPPKDFKSAGPGPLPEQTYVYALTVVIKGNRWWSRRTETALGSPSEAVKLTSPLAVQMTVPLVSDTQTRTRHIYRKLEKEHDASFRRVGEVKGRDETLFLDGWHPLGGTSELKGLGTNWDLKDNWITNVTAGATALVLLLASANTFGDVIGPAAEPALTAMAVAGAVAAVFIALGPLIVKAVGSDLSYTSVGGMLAAASTTLFGTLGQIAAITWLVEASVSGAALEIGVAAMGIFVGAVVLFYAGQSLWYYVKTGALFVATTPKLPGLAAQEQHTALL